MKRALGVIVAALAAGVASQTAASGEEAGPWVGGAPLSATVSQYSSEVGLRYTPGCPDGVSYGPEPGSGICPEIAVAPLELPVVTPGQLQIKLSRPFPITYASGKTEHGSTVGAVNQTSPTEATVSFSEHLQPGGTAGVVVGSEGRRYLFIFRPVSPASTARLVVTVLGSGGRPTASRLRVLENATVKVMRGGKVIGRSHDGVLRLRVGPGRYTARASLGRVCATKSVTIERSATNLKLYCSIK